MIGTLDGVTWSDLAGDSHFLRIADGEMPPPDSRLCCARKTGSESARCLEALVCWRMVDAITKSIAELLFVHRNDDPAAPCPMAAEKPPYQDTVMPKRKLFPAALASLLRRQPRCRHWRMQPMIIRGRTELRWPPRYREGRQ